MAIQGIKGNILELLFSSDKKIQDFFSSVKSGDLLKGRIIEIFPNENKAIINFKGFNIISQIPENFNMTKGETINVIVTNINDKIQMKILNSDINLIASSEIVGNQNENNTTLLKINNYINILKGINLPVNEQNLYIVQKLIDYGLPVNKENISDVSDKLINYFEKKGIDIRALNVTNQNIAKEIVIENIIKFARESDDLFKNLNFIIKSPNQYFINLKDTFTRLLNLLNISQIMAQKNLEINLTTKNNSIILEINNSKYDIKNIYNILNSLKSINANIETTGSSVKITINNIYDKFKELIENFTKWNLENRHIIKNLENFLNDFKNLLINIQNNSSKIPDFNNELPEKFNILNENGIKLLNDLKNYFISLKQNINSSNHASVQSSLKDALNLTLTINQVANEITKNFNLYVKNKEISQMNKDDIKFIKNELNVIINAVKNLTNKTDINKIEYKPFELLDIHSNLKYLINNLSKLNILKENSKPVINNKNNMMNFVDIESTLESIVFLKSRNLPVENTYFVDLMQKYFQNGMKLNQNIEYLLINFDKFEKQFNTENKNSEINNLLKIIQDIRDIFYKIAISTDENTLNQKGMQNQIMNFIFKSGINLESQIKNLLTPEINDNSLNTSSFAKGQIIQKNEHTNINDTNNGSVRVSELKDNLKSQLVKLENLIENIDTNKYNPEHKEIINNLKKGADDLLTNINALQFINQKSSSFDMLYTQLPVFINNKFFNGEIQVWYRKGSLKQNIDHNEPLNIVFLLNTSNLGNVKISMFVHKQDIECIINTENDKAKQILNKNRVEFLNNIEKMNYKIKNFMIKIENDLSEQSEKLREGYINIGKIDLKA